MPRASAAAARASPSESEINSPENEMDVIGRTFDGGNVDTDSNSYSGCTFNSVQFRYAGGEHPSFDNCTFNGEVTWNFHGHALRTIQFLQRIANDEGGDRFIADMFAKGKYYVD